MVAGAAPRLLLSKLLDKNGAIAIFKEGRMKCSFRECQRALCAASTQSRDQQVRQTAVHGGRMRILYVEDNDDNVYMLKNRLSRAGFTVIVATDGAPGVAMAASEQPDLILMDLTLPGIDGEEATRRIKADPVTKHIPVIALTANGNGWRNREEALAAGCDDFDTKPVELPRLLGKILVRWRQPGVPRERLRRRAARCRRHRGQLPGVGEPQSHILRRGDETAWLGI